MSAPAAATTRCIAAVVSVPIPSPDERNRVFRHYYLALVKIVDDLLTATLERTFGFFRIERHTLFKALFDAWSDLTL